MSPVFGIIRILVKVCMHVAETSDQTSLGLIVGRCPYFRGVHNRGVPLYF